MHLLTWMLPLLVTMTTVSSDDTALCPQVNAAQRCSCWSSDVTCDDLGVTDLNFLRPLPPDFDRLYVYRNNLGALQAGSLDVLANVTWLTMQHNRITDFDTQALAPLVSLENLDLAYNEIEEFDLRGVELTRLRTLDLSYNGLLRLNLNPNLKRLTSLMLEGNRLTIPESTFAFPNVIERLKISKNKVGNDLRFLRNLPNVATVWLTGNGITSVPEETFEWNKKVQFLRLDDNSISDVNFLKNLPLLRGLNLTGNRLESIPVNTFSNMSMLEYLYLGHNELFDTKFITYISNNLATLQLSNNAISIISTYSMQGKNELARLILSRNKLSDLSFISKLPNLEVLLVDNNNLHSIFNYQFNKSKINFLDISNNRIDNTEFVPHSGYLKYLYMSDNKLSKVNTKSIENSIIEIIDFSGNGQRSLEFVRHLPLLKELMIANNDISLVPDDIFRDNAALEKLNISGNPIGNMNFVFYTSRMRWLIASDCNIQSIDESPLKCSRNVEVNTVNKSKTLSFIKSTSELWEVCYGKTGDTEDSFTKQWTVLTMITMLSLSSLVLLLSITLLETVIRCRRQRYHSYLKISDNKTVPC